MKKAVIAGVFLLVAATGVSGQAVQPRADGVALRQQLSQVLRRILPSMVQVVEEDDASFNSAISSQLFEYAEMLLFVGDLSTLAELEAQLKINKKEYWDYAEEVHDVVASKGPGRCSLDKWNLPDGADRHRRDTVLRHKVMTAIECGLLDSAEKHIAQTESSRQRAQLHASVAAAWYKKGERSKADAALGNAFAAALEPDATSILTGPLDPSHWLANCAPKALPGVLIAS